MRLCPKRFTTFFTVCAVCFAPITAHAVSCTTQSEMTQTQRSQYEQAARSLGADILAGNTAAVQSNTVAAVAAEFSGIAGTIGQVAPMVQRATLTVDALYNLNALDLKAGSGAAQFFCSVANSALLVTVTIPQLPPGNYLLAVLHATGVEHPQQITLLLQNNPTGSAAWKLAGLYVRPMTAAGHDGVWFWKQARNYGASKQNWNAYFYYQTAAVLLNPVDFLSSPNLEKLEKEQQSVRPPDLPGKSPLVISARGNDLEISSLRTDTFGGELDLVVNYKTKGVSDPAATRTQIVALMKALLAAHPELRTGFHGLWVYAHYDNGQSFAIELPMNQIEP